MMTCPACEREYLIPLLTEELSDSYTTLCDFCGASITREVESHEVRAWSTSRPITEVDLDELEQSLAMVRKRAIPAWKPPECKHNPNATLQDLIYEVEDVDLPLPPPVKPKKERKPRKKKEVVGKCLTCHVGVTADTYPFCKKCVEKIVEKELLRLKGLI